MEDALFSEQYNTMLPLDNTLVVQVDLAQNAFEMALRLYVIPYSTETSFW